MSKIIITINRESGSGGREVAYPSERDARLESL